MSDLAVIAQPGALDQYADAGAFVIHSCERAKDWLVQCIAHGEIDQIVELKSQAEAIRVYTTTKQLGRDAELAAAEIVRRAERGIGVCIRKGQAAGEIAGREAAAAHRVAHQTGDNSLVRPSPLRYATSAELSANGGGIYAMTDDVTDEQFDEAIDEAKAEGNLSRANVVRKLKPETAAPKPADRHAIHYRAPHPKAERIINETIAMLEGIASGLALIEDVQSLDAEKRQEWFEALSLPLAAITRFKKELAK